MKKIKGFSDFVLEKTLSISNPDYAGDSFAKILNAQKEVKEEPKGSNKGKDVEKYLKSTGLGPGYPWCMAFVYSVFEELSKSLGTSNPLPRTAGVMNHWNSADKNLKIDIEKAKKDPSLIKPGQIFFMVREGSASGLGHSGIVLGVDSEKKEIICIEGNTNDQRSGEGDRVGINRRKIDSPILGFVDYFKDSRNPEFEDKISKVIGTKIEGITSQIPDEDTVLGDFKGKIKPGIGSIILQGLIKTATGQDISTQDLASISNYLK